MQAIKGGMRNALLVIVLVALLPVSSAAAAQTQKSDKPNPTGRQHQLKSARAGNPCAVYGAGFVKVEGTGTCVKIGGAASIGVGGSR